MARTRKATAYMCNDYLERGNHAERIDHRSFIRQGKDEIPTIHLGVAAHQMEKRGIRTERGDINREIEVSNQRLRQLKARLVKQERRAGLPLARRFFLFAYSIFDKFK